MAFAPVRKVTAAIQVAEAIRQQVVDGTLAPGEALPSERELARQMEVNRSTVREALHRLEGMGLVKIHQGGATRVNDVLVDAGLRILPLLVAPRGVPDAELLQDLMAIRGMLLAWTAREVARAVATEGSALVARSRLRETVERLEAPGTTATELQLGDFDFFAELARLTGNRVIGLLIEPVRQVYLHNRTIFEALYRPGSFDAAHHRRVLDAIERGDADAAASAMEAYADAARFGEEVSS
ncbi:MAG: FadR family transcriptional regulator [Deltaproteobacteria bacterium]|jgi:DNA-binding FadR family transcriptional regulator|nr:FadR family transcriptional regulator [Deltaproteobacteria bacterium]MBW2531598.1 FadR family transcriptional regulator [Deltaproteobacteria bacterium]